MPATPAFERNMLVRAELVVERFPLDNRRIRSVARGAFESRRFTAPAAGDAVNGSLEE